MRKELVHIYYCDGKRKTTAGIGLCIRVAAAGLKVLVFQFLIESDSSEIIIQQKIDNITIVKGLERVKFTFMMKIKKRLS